MFASLFILCAIAFADTKTLAVQICLDRQGYSCNTIDGVWGRKCQRALARYAADRQVPVPQTPEAAYDLFFSHETNLFKTVTLTAADLAAVAPLPADAAARAALPRMGYESVREMLAERGHLSLRAIERLNPGVKWNQLTVCTTVRLPDFPPIDEELAVWPKDRRNAPKRPEAALVRISLGNFEVTAYDKDGRLLGLFPCSIAKNKSKLPPHGALKVTTALARPNYTYTPDFTPKGQKMRRYVWPEGENCPIGVAWLGLNLPGYGIHGTPRPESIGNAESHGCFRLANWNAARLYALCAPGTKVIVEP